MAQMYASTISIHVYLYTIYKQYLGDMPHPRPHAGTLGSAQRLLGTSRRLQLLWLSKSSMQVQVEGSQG